MEVTSLEVRLRFELERRARLETLGWCLPTDQDWREASQVKQQETTKWHRSELNFSLSTCPTEHDIHLRILSRLPPGTACEFVVNTSSAGPGALAVTIDGPSKVKMDCVECPEGYRVTYTPMAPGNYLISIKYGGPYHIVGSPFKAKITGEEHRYIQPDKIFWKDFI